jgi:hypothetical protein
MTSIDKEYDIVLDTLQKQRDRLWKMTQSNMNHDMFNIMDQIRFEQIDQLDRAMKLWKEQS